MARALTSSATCRLFFLAALFFLAEVYYSHTVILV
jgi:hypothetical protein